MSKVMYQNEILALEEIQYYIGKRAVVRDDDFNGWEGTILGYVDFQDRFTVKTSFDLINNEIILPYPVSLRVDFFGRPARICVRKVSLIEEM